MASHPTGELYPSPLSLQVLYLSDLISKDYRLRRSTPAQLLPGWSEHTPHSGPLHECLPLLDTLPSQLSAWLPPSLGSGLSFPFTFPIPQGNYLPDIAHSQPPWSQSPFPPCWAISLHSIGHKSASGIYASTVS